MAMKLKGQIVERLRKASKGFERLLSFAGQRKELFKME